MGRHPPLLRSGGPYCVMAFEAVAMMRSAGIKSRRLEEGMPEWRAAGLPVEAD
jgi:ArsR family transcriptional regulator